MNRMKTSRVRTKSVKALRMLTPGIVLAAICLASIVVSMSHPTPPAYAQTDSLPALSQHNVRIGVLGLFHPREFRVSAVTGQALILQAGGRSVVLEKSSGIDVATIRISGASVAVTAGTSILAASAISLVGRNNKAVDFMLAIPGKISRRYHGTLEISPSSDSLLAVVTLDQETAVASAVAAESAPGTPLEALKAQAVAARSYFVAGRGGHREFDFCDTTHCQFLRNPPGQDSPVTNAVNATRGLVLAYNSHPFPAMYTRSCSGQTRTPAQLGIPPASYPYFSVRCAYCRSHPARWTSRVSASDAALLQSNNELARLNVGRRLGWSTVPSNDFNTKKDGDQVVLKGIGNGHGIGLCQAGAKAMAQQGSTFREILSHYYPNTAVVSWPVSGKEQSSLNDPTLRP